MLSNNKNKTWMILAVSALILSSCKKDFSDPNRATSDKVLASPSGLNGVSVGLQRIYSLGRAS